MKHYPMPTGVPKYMTKITADTIHTFYGIVNVRVRSPQNIFLPILPIKSTNNHIDMGIIYPEGEFDTICFSEELKTALHYGYEIITIYDGYSFEKNIVFDDFVNELYSWRQTEKNLDMKKLIKLILNSLYGRYGTQYEMLCDISNKKYKYAIKCKFENVAISVAIAAYSRLYMYEFLINNNLYNNLLYMDTDSIIITTPLNAENISTELGAFKLVANINKLLCLGSKFYMYKTDTDYVYVFKGFQKEKYNMLGTNIYNHLLNQALKSSQNQNEITIHFDVENKKGFYETKVFCFYKKRRFIYQGNLITTKPWKIMPAS